MPSQALLEDMRDEILDSSADWSGKSDYPGKSSGAAARLHPVPRITDLRMDPLPPPPTLRPGHAHDLRIKLPPAVSTCLNPAQGTDWERPGRPIFCAVDAKAECDRTVGVCLTMCMIVRGGPEAARAAPRIATSTNIQRRRFRFAVSYRPDS